MPTRQHSAKRRHFITAASAASLGVALLATPARVRAAPRKRLLRAPRLKPGDTIALINPSNAVFARTPYRQATETLQALGFKVREAPNLHARWGPYGGTDAQRAGDVNAMFADPDVQGILALTGGSGGNRILPLIDYGLIARNPKVLGGFSDLTALINAVQSQTGLVTFHSPMGGSEWNPFSVQWFRGALLEAKAQTLANEPEREDVLAPQNSRISTVRGGRASGPLVGGNLAVLSAMAGSRYWPDFDGAVLILEETNEYIYRVDRMLSTLKLAGALDRLAGVVLGGFTNCGLDEGKYSALTLDEVFDDYFKPLNVPVYSGALFGHIQRKFTLPIGLAVEMDADAGTVRYLQPAVL
jgi:muramoyltetrapeptide carboxypeptidase